MANDKAKLLRALGMILKAPHNYFQIKQAGERADEEYESDKNYRVLQNLLAEQQLTDRADTQAKIEALTSPLPEFLMKQPRTQTAKELFAKLAPTAFAKGVIEPPEVEKPTYEYTVPSGDYAGQTFENLTANQWRLMVNQFEKPEKPLYPVKIGGKTYTTGSESEYFDYLSGRGRYAPQVDKSKQIIRDAMNIAEIRAQQMNKNLADLSPQKQSKIIKQAGMELDAKGWEKASGGDPLIVKLPGFLGSKTYYFWGKDKQEVIDFQDKVRRGEASQEEYEKFIEDMGY